MPKTRLSLTTVEREVSITARAIEGAWLSDINGDNIMKFPQLFSLDKIPVDTAEFPTQAEIRKWKHLDDVQLGDYRNKDIDLLLGANAYLATEPLEVIPSRGEGSPFAVRTRYGWIISGPRRVSSTPAKLVHTVACHALIKCHNGTSVYVPDKEQTITCACNISKPSTVTSAGLSDDSFTHSASSPGPRISTDQDETFPAQGNVGDGLDPSLSLPGSGTDPSSQRELTQDGTNHVSGPTAEQGGSLADCDCVAPDGSVAMTSRAAQPPDVAELAVLAVLTVLVAALLGVAAMLCCSQHHSATPLEEQEDQRETQVHEEGETCEGITGTERKLKLRRRGKIKTVPKMKRLLNMYRWIIAKVLLYDVQ